MTYFAPVVDDAAAEVDKAQTFAESDVSLSQTGTEVSSESVRLLGDGSETTASRPADDDSSNLSSRRGVRITLNEYSESVTATLSSNTSGATEAYVLDVSDESVIEGPVTVSSGSVTFTTGLDPGDYYVAVDDSGSSYTVGSTQNVSYPYESENVDITSGYNAGDRPGYAYNISSVTAESTAITDGTVTVGWPMPPDLFAWDTVVFEADGDGGSVEVYVEEDQAGGWVEIEGPVSRGDRIGTADPSNNVRYRVELSRPGPSADPRLESIYRRYKL